MDIDSIYGTSKTRHKDLDYIAGTTDRKYVTKASTSKKDFVDGFNGKNRTYSNATKAAAVKLCKKLGNSYSEAGKQLGIPHSTLYKWCNYE